jgi:hypothetical protein
MSAVDAEDGYCPECGTIISSNSIFAADEEDDLLDDDLDPELDDDLDEDF